MPRHGELTNQEKVVSILAHRGWPKSTLGRLTDKEVACCVEIYDKTVGPMSQLNGLFDSFWADHRERLDAEKAVTEETIQHIEQDAKAPRTRSAKKPSN